MFLVAALVATALMGGVAGYATRAAGSGSGVRVALASAEGGQATCRAVVIPGRPAQLVVSIDEPRDADATDYVVEAAGAGAPTETLGVLHLVDGHGVLSAPVGASGSSIRSVRVFQAGQLRYEARF